MAKLVRDLIPEIIKKNGGLPEYFIADEKDYKERLYEKLLEEFKEFREEESIEEMADLFEVLYHILDFHNFDRKTLEETRKKKKSERGGFKNRIILERSTT